jgi:segregation and condensation protein B
MSNVTNLPTEDRKRNLRIVEAVIFAAAEPVSTEALAERLPEGIDIDSLLREVQQIYANRGVNLVQVAGRWTFRTAEDLGFLLSREVRDQRKLSRPALETLAIVAYHQPVTRAEIEEVRGISTTKGTLDVLLETGWVKMRGRRKTPGRPITYGTTEAFLTHFGLNALTDLPGTEELRGAGLLDPGLAGPPMPRIGDELTEDEDPLEDPLQAEQEEAFAAELRAGQAQDPADAVTAQDEPPSEGEPLAEGDEPAPGAGGDVNEEGAEDEGSR